MKKLNVFLLIVIILVAIFSNSCTLPVKNPDLDLVVLGTLSETTFGIYTIILWVANYGDGIANDIAFELHIYGSAGGEISYIPDTPDPNTPITLGHYETAQFDLTGRGSIYVPYYYRIIMTYRNESYQSMTPVTIYNSFSF